MIKTDEFFRAEIHSRIEDELVSLMESEHLGVPDGSSSGSHQFDVSFCEVTEYEKAKTVVGAFLRKKYPEMQFVISEDYETTFDQL